MDYKKLLAKLMQKKYKQIVAIDISSSVKTAVIKCREGKPIVTALYLDELPPELAESGLNTPMAGFIYGLLKKYGLNSGALVFTVGAVNSALLTLELPKMSENELHEAARWELAQELGIGEITLTDILKELEKPARDPREDMPAPILRSDVLDMKDLKPGMILKGTVRNVIDFGAFVDIGVHQDGLVHISQITDRFIKHPLEAVSVGDVVDVKVLDVDVAKKRISLTMRLDQEAKPKDRQKK